jgi:TPR repeat protein
MLKYLLIALLSQVTIINAACASDGQNDNAANFNKDYATAIENYRSAASKNDVNAQFELGRIYVTGQGVAKDYFEAVRLWKLAAAQGHAQTQFNLGNSYKNQRGVVQNYSEAMRWYKLAASQGSGRAQHSLGVMYANGQGVNKDYLKAYMWIDLAASEVSDIDADVAKIDRDTLAAVISRVEVEYAQKLARECKIRNFKSCD